MLLDKRTDPVLRWSRKVGVRRASRRKEEGQRVERGQKQSHRHRTLVKTVFCGLPTLFYPCMHFLNLHWYELKMWTLCRCSSKVSVCFKWITHMTRNQSPHQLTLSHIHKAGQLSCFSFYHPASLTCFHWCCHCSVRGIFCCSCWELGSPRREPTQSWLAQLKPRMNCRIRDATLQQIRATLTRSRLSHCSHGADSEICNTSVPLVFTETSPFRSWAAVVFLNKTYGPITLHEVQIYDPQTHYSKVFNEFGKVVKSESEAG